MQPFIGCFADGTVVRLVAELGPCAGVIRNGLLNIKIRKSGKIVGQSELYRLQMIQLECPRYSNLFVLLIFR